MEEYISICGEEIDRQHRELFRHIEALRKAVREGSGSREEVLRTVRYLDDFIKVHFSTEERYMRLHCSTAILQHESEHAAFAKDFDSLKQRILSEETGQGMEMLLLAIQIGHKLQKWLRDHIGTADRKLGEYLVGRI